MHIIANSFGESSGMLDWIVRMNWAIKMRYP